MDEYGRYLIAALLIVAVLSLGIGEAVRWSFRNASADELAFDIDSCEDASVTAYERRGNRTDAHPSGDPVTYEGLAPAHRRAFDRALRRANGTASIDPATLPDLPRSNETYVETRHTVVRNDTAYRLSVRTRGCYVGGPGPPEWLLQVLVPFLLIDEFIRAAWQFLVVAAGLVAGWWAFQRWVRFGP